MNHTKTPLSVALITKNEAVNLPQCLDSVGFAGQIVVVDSGSNDGTVQIATEFGCEVFTNPWEGFGAQKQFAIDRCHHKWVLVLDADERIPKETADKIKSIIHSEKNGVHGYSFPRKNYFQGRWIKHSGWWPDRVVRLFRKDSGQISNAKVHESVEISGSVEALKTPIEHYTESRFSQILMKIDQYSTLGAEEAFARGKRASIWSATARSFLTFIGDYFLSLGILDGAQGLTLAIADSINKFLKYAKLHELNKKAGEHNKE